MYAEKPEKCQQNPCYCVVEITAVVSQIRLAVHGRNKKKIDDPSDKEKPQGKKPDGSCNGFAVVEPMGARKTENP